MSTGTSSTNAQLVLIVDDNNENIKLLGSLLSSEGYRIGVANDGVKAIEFVKNMKPNLILLDVMMPNLDGYETCEKIKSDPSSQSIPIIFLTAKTDTADIVKGFKVGAVDYVAKPFVSEVLLARVETHIRLHTLSGLIPICSNCKNIRNDKGYWNSIEEYIENHSEILLSHSICPTCMTKLYGDEFAYVED